jgi:hypothetical protein
MKMKTAPLTKQIVTERELLGMNADQIKKDVLSGQPRNSLQQQRDARRTQAPVGRLEKFTHDDLADDSKKRAYLQRLEADGLRFLTNYPQFSASGEDGAANLKAMNAWLSARGVGGTYDNLVKAFNDIVATGLILNPAAIGLAKYGQRLTPRQIGSIPSGDYLKLVSPFRDEPDKPVEEQTAEEYRKSHPEAFDVLRTPVRKMEERYILDAVEKFKQMAPQYISSDANAQMLVKETAAQGLRINQASLLAVFNELVAAKKMKVNENVSAKGGSTTRTDFAG